MLIDSHCHIPHKKYEKTPDQITSEARQEGVDKLIVVGTNIKSNATCLDVVNTYENVFTTVGIYPNDEKGANIDNLIAKLEKQAIQNKVVGIGECGLDITEWKNQRPVEEQIILFEKQIELSTKLNLPLVIHNRNGDEKIIEILKKFKKKGVTGVAHCFVSDWNYAKELLDLGFYISFSGIITYPSGTSIHETVKKTPQDRILVETDAPYLPPQGKDGKRPKVNEPKYVKITAEKVADIRGITLDEVEEITYANTCSLFLKSYDCKSSK